MSSISPVSLLLTLSISLCSSSAWAAAKTLLVGLDGVQLERYEQLDGNLNLKRLHHRKAYTGGITGSTTQQTTISGPGWTTMLTGVWANKHGVTSNNESLRVNPDYPSLFKRLRQHYPKAYLSSLINWAPINTAFLLEDMKESDRIKSGLSDENVIVETLKVLDETSADFTFIQLDNPDGVGHSHCFGPAYDEALRAADRQLGRLLDKVEQRAAANPIEDWLIIVSTDHGRDLPNGCGHSGQTEQEKTIFVASNKTLNAEFTTPSPPRENPGPNNLYGYAAQTSIAPTILRHMGIALVPGWKLDGIPLIGELGVRKLRISTDGKHLLWHSTDSATARIEKNAQFAGEVPAGQQQWHDPHMGEASNDYTVQLRQTPASVRSTAPEAEKRL